MNATLTPWPDANPPSPDDLDALLRREGLSPRWWSNGPADRYAAHSHSYRKVLYCSRGTITFHVDGEDIVLSPGDRLDIPPNTSHSATVGRDGVECVEAAHVPQG